MADLLDAWHPPTEYPEPSILRSSEPMRVTSRGNGPKSIEQLTVADMAAAVEMERRIYPAQRRTWSVAGSMA